MNVVRSSESNDLLCDSLAERYDNLFARARTPCAQRSAVWEVLCEIFQPGEQILELNCGTGDEALLLSLYLGVSVVACDASEHMIETARHRIRAQQPRASIRLELLATAHVSKLRSGGLFDGALANLSGVNGLTDLHRVAADLASLVPVGAPVLVCVSTRFCLSETLWFLFHGKFHSAFRRSAGIASENAGDSAAAVNMHYATLGELRKWFSPFFVMRACTGIGVAVPPSYLYPLLVKYPRVLSLLCLIDRHISKLPLVRTIGDHMLLHFERVED